MSDETAINANGSAPASTSSSPRTTIATLSRENSTTSAFDLAGSIRGGRHKGSAEKRTSGRFLAALADGVGNAEGYISDQQPGTLPLPRYPGIAGAKPLPPHRVARIAHSFGLGTALPPGSAPHATSSFTYRRSTSANSYSRHHSRQTTATRLLLHVVPPAGLIEGNELVESGRNGDPLSRRGSLLPLHTTLHGQLQAIKREYNFPSTAGLILNLLDAKDNEDAESYVGPRLSEEAWSALWRPALNLDRREQRGAFTPKRPTSPPSPSASASAEDNPSDADMLTPSSSTAAEPSSAPPGDRSLRPLIIGRGLLTSPSTTTLASMSSFNSMDSFPTFPHSPSIFPPTPHSALPPINGYIPRSDSTSVNSDTASYTSSIRRVPTSTPIVGKIEFDIDLHKGRWYDQWSARKRSQPPPMLLSSRASSTSARASVVSPTASDITEDRPMMVSPVEASPEPVARSLATPFDFQASISLSSVHSEQSPSLAARLELPSSPRLESLSELSSPTIEESQHSNPDGYAQLDGDGDGDDDETPSDGESDYEPEEVTHTVTMVRLSRDAEMNEDELAWRDLQQEQAADAQLDEFGPGPVQLKRRSEFEPDLEGEIPEEDPIGGADVNDATKDLAEVVAIWNERQGTMDSHFTQESEPTRSSSSSSSTTSESESIPAVIVPVLSSPIVLNVDQVAEDEEKTEEREEGEDGEGEKEHDSPESLTTPQLPIFPLESTRSRTVPPPLHLRAPSDNADVRVQLVQASPSGSPEHASMSLAYLGNRANGSGEISPGPEGRLSPSASLDLLEWDNRSSVGSTTSSNGDDELGSQMRLSDKLDTLAKHIAQVSPKLLAEEPEYQSMSPRATPRELLERIAQSTPRFSAPALAGTPTFFSNGFARPTPGLPLILSSRSSPDVPTTSASAGSNRNSSSTTGTTTQWPALPFEHVANEMRANRTSPPSRPISNMSTITTPPARSLANSPPQPNADEEPAPFRKSLAPSEASFSTRSTSDQASSARTSIAASLNTTAHTSVADRPATPAVLDPPPRTFSLPQPSSRFSDDSFMSDAQHAAEEAASPETPPGSAGGLSVASAANTRISVRNFTKLFRSRSKSRDPAVRSSREFAPPVPIPHPQINSPRAVPPVPPPPPIPSQPQAQGPPPRTPRAVSPVVGKPNTARPGHAREDSGSDPFHFDQPQPQPQPGGTAKSSISVPSSPALESPAVGLPTAAAAPGGPKTAGESSTGEPRSAAVIRGKRGILKGWGTSTARPSSVRPTAPPPLTPPASQSQLQDTNGSMLPPRSTTPQQALEHSRNPSSASSLSARGLKMTHRESWVSIAENMVAGPSSSSSNGSSVLLAGPSPLVQAGVAQRNSTDGLMSIDEREATQFAAVAAQKRRETNTSLRPPISPASTESSQGGPRPSMDEMSTRSSQFEIVTPQAPSLQRSPSYIGPDRI